jgi:hypothetical protein
MSPHVQSRQGRGGGARLLPQGHFHGRIDERHSVLFMQVHVAVPCLRRACYGSCNGQHPGEACIGGEFLNEHRCNGGDCPRVAPVSPQRAGAGHYEVPVDLLCFKKSGRDGWRVWDSIWPWVWDLIWAWLWDWVWAMASRAWAGLLWLVTGAVALAWAALLVVAGSALAGLRAGAPDLVQRSVVRFAFLGVRQNFVRSADFHETLGCCVLLINAYVLVWVRFKSLPLVCPLYFVQGSRLIHLQSVVVAVR